MAGIRKKPKMPPKAPKVPKGPKLLNFRSEICKDGRKSRTVMFIGGPWNTLKTKVRLEVHDSTLVFTISGMTGRYRMLQTGIAGGYPVAEWEPVNVQIN